MTFNMIPAEQRDPIATEPPDEWLKLSDGELAGRDGRQDDPRGSIAALLNLKDSQPAPRGLTRFDNAAQLADSLDTFDRMRLISRLWASLTPAERATLLTIGFDRLFQSPSQQIPERAAQVEPSRIWRFLFDRENTSELYSAPRRFDLATVFVILTAYSILFAALTLVDQLVGLDLQPLLTLVFGGLVTAVAIGQAWYFHEANPRGVSVVVGAIAYTVLSIIVWIVYPGTFPGSVLFVVVINGIMGGALFGYCAGALVGGIFLFADVLRQKASANSLNDSPNGTDNEPADDLELAPLSPSAEN